MTAVVTAPPRAVAVPLLRAVVVEIIHPAGTIDTSVTMIALTVITNGVTETTIAETETTIAVTGTVLVTAPAALTKEIVTPRMTGKDAMMTARGAMTSGRMVPMARTEKVSFPTGLWGSAFTKSNSSIGTLDIRS